MFISVITVSDRCASGLRDDKSGPLAASLLQTYGEVMPLGLVPDGIDSVRGAIMGAAEAGADVIFTTGGTGITSRDLTPEATEPLLASRLAGVEQLIRSKGKVPAAGLSRGLVGIMEHAGRRILVVNAPGSPGGVRDAVDALAPVINHICEQLRDIDSHAAATWRNAHRSSRDKGDATVLLARMGAEPIDVEELARMCGADSAGAVVSFTGAVRNHDLARPVVAIEYQAHPDSGAVLERIARGVAADSGAHALAVIHRTGRLEVGDIALGAAVSASHRREAFDVLEKLIEEIKIQLPVWKKQEFADGTSEWTGQA